jgi:predicted O-methyltransferase YrrM
MSFWKDYIANTRYLAATSATASVFGVYTKTHVRRHRQRRVLWATNRRVGEQLDGLGNFTTRWFDHNAADWLRLIEREGLASRPLNVLEIGCWEGRSTVFMAHFLPQASITAVDTWAGSDEHVGDGRLGSIETRFDANVARFGHRVSKYKQSSLGYFVERQPKELFDLIYVDGSHFVDDVLIDALLAFRALKVGGILVFDDYIWNYYPNVRDNPGLAVNELLRLKRGSCRLLSVTSQLVLQRLA